MTVNKPGCLFYFYQLLTIVFITLKLRSIINWSWWLVLAPTWIPIAITGLFVGATWVIALWRAR